MRKKVFGRKLSRATTTRKALFRSLIRGLVSEGKIVTTTAKAKAVQPDVEKLMTLVRKNSLSSRRSVLAKLGNDWEVTDKLFSTYMPITEKRVSGYTRIIPFPRRTGDNAPVSRLEWVDTIETVIEPKKVKKVKSDLVKK